MSGLCVHFYALNTWLCLLLHELLHQYNWRGGEQHVALLRCNGCVDCGLQKAQWTNTSRWHGSPNHHCLWKLHTGLQATWILCLSTLPPDSGTLISKWHAKFTFLWTEDFGPLSNICWCWSTVFSEVHSQCSHLPGNFRALLPSADQLYADADFIFQQDLAPAHTAKCTKSWFSDHGVTVLD